MKSLIKKIYNQKKIIQIRNLLNLKPLSIFLDNDKRNISISDSFLWRTDNGFSTIFKFIDILNFFYEIKINTAEILFYSKTGKLIKNIKIKNLKSINQLTINKNFLNGIEDYGYFNIFHENLDDMNKNFIISNRCYVGFSKDNNFYSYVHGNLLSKYKQNNIQKISSDLIQTSLLINQEYSIQNDFKRFEKTELYFSNPTSELIKFKIFDKKYFLEKNSCKIITLNKINTVLTIKSNCMLLRPIIFNYNKEFFDVYHG